MLFVSLRAGLLLSVLHSDDLLLVVDSDRRDEVSSELLVRVYVPTTRNTKYG